MTILITGSTGHLGSLVIDELIARGTAPADIIAGARDTAKAAAHVERGVRAVELDYDRPETVASALQGVDAVLLVSASEPGRRVPQHQAVIDAAAAAGVAKLVYTSAPFATTREFILAPEHKATEELIATSGIPAVILRNNWYTENYTGRAAQAIEAGELVGSAHDGLVASASRRDYAAAAAVALVEDGHVGQVYELAGDTAWSFADLAATIGVPYRDVTTEEHAAALTAAGLDAGMVSFVTTLEADIAGGILSHTDGTLARLIGRPTTPLAQGLREDGLGISAATA